MSAPASAEGSTKALRIRLEGGLGNQLFQYAAARSGAARLGCPLEVAVIGAPAAPNETPRDFALDWLVPRGALVAGDGPGRLARRLMRAFPRAVPKGSFVEAGFAYDPRILDIAPGTTLMGYFQSWRYFDDRADALRTEIARAAPRSAWLEETAQTLSSQGPWTAVHIRRGDYANARNAAFHGLLGPAYYARALEQVREHAPDCAHGPIVVVSDEPAVASAMLTDTLHGRRLTLVEPPPQSHPMESVMLMAQASAIVTANSSFSWWGAWLAGPAATVVSPGTWFRGARHDEGDLRPPSWMTAPSDFMSTHA